MGDRGTSTSVNPEEGVDPMGSDAFRLHNVNVYEERPDRAYLGYIDGGVYILDISDKSSPKVVSNWNPHNPYQDFLILLYHYLVATLSLYQMNVSKMTVQIGQNSLGYSTPEMKRTSFQLALYRYPQSRSLDLKGGVLALIIFMKIDLAHHLKVKKF